VACSATVNTTAENLLRLLAELPEEERQRVLAEAVTEHGEGEGVVGWTPTLFLLCFLFAATYFAYVIHHEFNRFNKLPSGGPASFPNFLKYRFGLWYSRTRGAAAVVLVALSVALLVVGGIVHAFITEDSIGNSLWSSWTWIASPDGGGSAETYGGRLMGIFVSLGGMLIFAMLMSVVSAKFEEMLDTFKNAGLPVIEGGHTVILGWNPMVPYLVGELCEGAESSGGGVIVVLSPMAKVDVEELIEDSEVDCKNSIVTVRSGDRRKKEDLEMVALESAAVVIVVSKDGVSREDSDARQINSLLAMRAARWPSKGRCIVQCQLVTNRMLFGSLCYSEDNAVVVTGDFLGALLVKSTQEKGLARAITQLLGFDGSEFYVTEVMGTAGIKFNELLFGLPGVVPVGVVRADGKPELLPPMETCLTGDEQLLLLADDVSALPAHVDMKAVESAKAVSVIPIVQEVAQPSGVVADTQPSTVIILGWNEAVGAILAMLDNVLSKGSIVVIYSPYGETSRIEFIKLALKRRGKECYQNFEIQHLTGSLCARTPLKTLPLNVASKIFVLADSTISMPREKDGSTLAAVVQIKDIIWEMGRQDEPIIVPQILLQTSEEQFINIGICESVLSDRLSGMICAVVAVNPQMQSIIEELLSDTGCDVCIHYLSDYPALNGQSGNALPVMTFNEIMAMAARAGEVAIGWRPSGRNADDWIMNPQERWAPQACSEAAQVVTLRRPPPGKGSMKSTEVHELKRKASRNNWQSK